MKFTIRFYNFCTYLVPFLITLCITTVLFYLCPLLFGATIEQLKAVDFSYHFFVFLCVFIFGGLFCALIEMGGTASDKPWFGPGLRIRICSKCNHRMNYNGIYGVCPEDGHWDFLYKCPIDETTSH